MSHPYPAYLTEAGQIDRSKVMKLAIASARYERDGSAKAGIVMTWAEATSYGLRRVWDRAISARNNVAATKAPAAAPVVVDRATALRRELETVQFIDSTSAMIERKAAIEAELSRMAA